MSEPQEWVEICGWAKRLDARNVKGWIPRFVLEGMGIDCSPLDSRDQWGRQGTVWFSQAQSERIRKHRHFEPQEDDHG